MTNITILRDEDALQQWASAWDALEVRARSAGREDRLFASHRYVAAAWEHLRTDADRLFVVLLGEGERLDAVWPLVLRPERRGGLTLQVLRPIGIWEGERPAPLCEDDLDPVWPRLWAALQAHRDEWHVLDLREVDEGTWPARQLPQQAGLWWRVTVQADHTAPWQPFTGAWSAHAGRHGARPVVTGAAKLVLDDPSGIVEGLARCLAIEASQAGVEGLYRLGDDERRVAFYRAFLPRLAGRGEAEVWLLQVGGEDVAGLIRWRCGAVWIERHLVEAAGWRDSAAGAALLVEALSRSWGSGAQSSQLMLVPDEAGPGAQVRPWYEQARPTQRVSVWNLRSRVLPLALLQKVRGR